MNLVVCMILLLMTGCQSNNAKKEPNQWTPELRISTEDDPSSLDPRQVRDLSTVTPLHMLFEGLTRAGNDGKTEAGIAVSWEVSKDQLTYTFNLRDAVWSNGDPMTAHDFEESWKSTLDPRFPAPNAYQLFVIKGAKEAKEGKLALDEIGIHAKDDKTLVVEMEAPTPYFLELTSTHFYFPVHQSTRENKLNAQDGIISNGPFVYHHWKHHNEFGVERNPQYWDVDHVKLNSIALLVVDENTAFNMFERGDIDWVGSPLSNLPQDAIQNLKDQGRLSISTAAGTHLFRFNTLNKSLDNADIRTAFAFALNRQEIVDHITQGNQTPAIGIVPPSFGLENTTLIKDNDPTTAKQLFAKGLIKKDLTPDQFPSVTLSFASNERNKKIAQAVQEQWQKVLGVTVNLDGNESQIFFDKLKRRDFQIAIGSWYADIRDPINFLEVFKYSHNATNNTEWENPIYVALLDLSQKEPNPEKRMQFLKKAEALLMTEMPVMPLFHGSYNYLKNDKVKDVYFSDLGYLDFKNASIN
jgi:oligopeptide transport system substrate-binding protein